MKFLIVFVSCLLLKNAFCDDKECKKQLKDVLGCMKKKHEDNKASDDKKLEEMKEKVSKCFSDNECKEPDYDGSSSDKHGGMVEKFKQKFDEQPEAVKKCMKDEFKKIIVKKLNECLEKKHVAPIKEDEADDDLMGDFHTEHGGDHDGDDEKHKIMKGIAAVGKALRQCSDDKGDDARDKVASCIKPLKDDVKKEMCKRKDECKKSVKLSDSCEKRFNEVKKALCECKHEKLEEAKKKVEELQAKHRDVTLDEAKDVGGDNAMKDFNPDTIENCYKKNNVNPPMELALFRQIQGSGKQGGLLGLFKPKITQKQLQSIHDKIEDQLQNKECAHC